MKNLSSSHEAAAFVAAVLNCHWKPLPPQISVDFAIAGVSFDTDVVVRVHAVEFVGENVAAAAASAFDLNRFGAAFYCIQSTPDIIYAIFDLISNPKIKQQ